MRAWRLRDEGAHALCLGPDEMAFAQRHPGNVRLEVPGAQYPCLSEPRLRVLAGRYARRQAFCNLGMQEPVFLKFFRFFSWQVFCGLAAPHEYSFLPLFNALYVFARFGVDAEHVALVYEHGYLDLRVSLKGHQFGTTLNGISFYRGVCLGYF